MSDADRRIQHAGNFALSAMRDLRDLADFLGRAAESAPEFAERLDGLTQQVWAMTDVARGVESALAEIHAELRATK